MASNLTTLVHVFQASFSAYNLYLASISITKLRKYEETSKKAAEWSNIAEEQLHKTRTTQASGTLAILCSFLSSTYTIFTANGKLGGLAIAVVNIDALMAAREHVGRFWKGKAKIPLPGVGDYNEAISNTQEVRLNSAYLAASWGLAGVLGLLG